MAADAMTGFHDQLLAEVRDMIDKKLASVTETTAVAAMNKLIARPAPAPQVTVAAPHVVAQVTAPEMELSPVIEVTVDLAPVAAEMKRQAADNAETLALLRQVIALLNAPVTKTVERGAGNWITKVTETR